MLVVIDNYDSFTYNLVQRLGEIGAVLEVYRNDKVTLDEIERRGPSHIIISPGPCTPNEALGLNALMVTEPFSPSTPQLAISNPCWSTRRSAKLIKRSWEMRSVARLLKPTIFLVVGERIMVISFN